ncbi:MAG: transposase [Bacteroidota bacterium]
MNIRNEILEPDTYYHIYNRGINGEKIFDTKENYLFFLKKITAYVSPVCEVYAYCLMPNHFHFLIRVKSENEIETFVKVLNFDKGSKQEKGLHSFDSVVSKQIGKFISSYSQAYNKNTNRHGALLESPFKRKRIVTEEYLRNLIIYIHLNTTDLKQNFETYPFSSFPSILSNAKTNLMREEAITLFGDLENFIYSHHHPPKFDFEF